MRELLNIVLGIAMFLFLITIHEGGHFLGAKLSGIKVNEFAVGMGPKIWGKQGEETLYSLRALPIGGYVMMEGEESDSEDSRSYNNAKPWKRFLTILAGPATNLIFAVILIFLLNFTKGFTTTEINTFSDNSPAKASGMEVGDKIISINNNKIQVYPEVGQELQKSSGEVDIVVDRNSEKVELKVIPIEEDGRKIIGVTPVISKDLANSFVNAISTTGFMMGEIWNSLKGLFTGALGLEQLGGPVAVINQVGQAANIGPEIFLFFTALISINLGFFNLLPIPALDGSKLLFITAEMITGKPINRKFEENISIIGFLFLIGLMILVTIKDVVKLF